MKSVTIEFTGFESEALAKSFYTWMVDGGLEDEMVMALTDETIQVEGIKDFDPSSLTIQIDSSEREY